jgi:hypothetical protein
MILRLDVSGELMTQVETAAKARGVSFQEFVTNALSSAVAQTKIVAPRTFSQKVHDFGTHLENPWTLLSDLETSAALARK